MWQTLSHQKILGKGNPTKPFICGYEFTRTRYSSFFVDGVHRHGIVVETVVSYESSDDVQLAAIAWAN